MINLCRASCLLVITAAISATTVPCAAAPTPWPPCVASSKLDDNFRSAVQLLSDESWQSAATKFESILASFEAPAAAVYAAYSYAKLADFNSTLLLIGRAKSGRACLTATETRQLNWLILVYNESTTIPQIYGRSGGTLSADQRSIMTREGIEQRYFNALKTCDQKDAIESTYSRQSSTNKAQCVARADKEYEEIRFKYRDPCRAFTITPESAESTMKCIRRFQSREFGKYDPLMDAMPEFPQSSNAHAK